MADGFQVDAYIADVLGGEVITQRGDEHIMRCLIFDHEHDDATPGASINAEKLVYNCFKCHSAGTLKWLTEQVLGVGSSEARRLIEGKFVEVSKSPQAFLQELEASWDSNPSATMPSYNLRMLEGWLCYAQYLDKRGISHEVQKEMRTGIILDNQDDIGGELVTQPRLMIPHLFGGKLRGWTMRKLDERQLGTKYKHTGEFPKRHTLFNFDKAREFDTVVVVESPMSVLWMKTCGVHNCVATFGAEINPGQIDLLAKFRQVVFFPDGDRAGYRGLRRSKKGEDLGAVDVLMSRADVAIVDHSRDGWNDRDAAEYPKDELLQLLGEATPGYLWDWRDYGVQEIHAGSDRQGHST